MQYDSLNSTSVVNHLVAGDVGVLRTDTLYGIVAKADNQSAVERIFAVKQRSPHKPVLMLIANPQQMFDATVIPDTVAQLWPGKHTVIFPAPTAPEWVTRGSQTAAYRIPDDPELRRLLEQTGPLVAPSANPEGKPPAENCAQAVQYFGDAVDFYVDGGTVADVAPSQLFKLGPGNSLERLR